MRNAAYLQQRDKMSRLKLADDLPWGYALSRMAAHIGAPSYKEIARASGSSKSSIARIIGPYATRENPTVTFRLVCSAIVGLRVLAPENLRHEVSMEVLARYAIEAADERGVLCAQALRIHGPMDESGLQAHLEQRDSTSWICAIFGLCRAEVRGMVELAQDGTWSAAHHPLIGFEEAWRTGLPMGEAREAVSA